MTFSPMAYALAGLALLSLILGGGWYVEDAAHDRTKSEHQAANDRAAREFAEAARAQEQAWADKVAAIDAQHQKELSDAKQTGERVAADLRSGAARLHRRWQSCEARGVPGAAADPGEPDAAADDRSASAGRAIGAAAECDAQVTALQRVIRSLQR